MKNLFFFYVLCILWCPLFGCKQVFDLIEKKNTVVLQFPQPHPAILLADPGYKEKWTVLWYEKDGQVHTLKGCQSGQKIQLQADFFTPLLAYEEEHFIPKGYIPPSGAFYPQHCTFFNANEIVTVIEITRIGGVGASCAQEAFIHSWADFHQIHILLSAFNWERFQTQVSTFSSPENLDRLRFLENILSGSIKIYDIKEKKIAPHNIHISHPLLQDGEIILSGYTKKYRYSLEDTAIQHSMLNDGQNILFTSKGYITVYVQKNGQSSSFFSPYILKDTS